MGQNRKIGKSRNKNKLKNADLFDAAMPLEKVAPKSPQFPNYDFKTEVKKDFDNEKRLLWAEIIVLLGILFFTLCRSYLLSMF